MFSLPEKKNLARTETINKSAKIKNRILTISIPAKEIPIKPIKPVNSVSTKNIKVCCFIFLVFISKLLLNRRDFIKLITIEICLTKE